MMENKLKMYIAVREGTPSGIAITSVAHAAVIAHILWSDLITDYQVWQRDSFKKVVCVANDKEFNKLKELGNTQVVTESALNGAETAIVLCPRAEWPNVVKFLRKYQ
jgi:hypothetical protein